MKLAYSVAEAAVEIGVAESVIRAAIRGSYLIAHRHGRRWVIRHEDLDDWIKTGSTDPLARAAS